jgi:hypothetical protein
MTSVLDGQQPVPKFLSVRGAEIKYGGDHRTYLARVRPDAVMASVDGRKTFPLYLPETIERWLAAGKPNQLAAVDGDDQPGGAL